MPRQKRYREFIYEGKKYRLPRCSHVVSYIEDFRNSEAGKAWLERVGDKEAKAITKRACNIGTSVHKAIELFYKSPEEYISYASKLDLVTKQYLNNYSTFLKNKNPILAEQDVAYFDPIKKHGVVGKFDALSQLNINNFYYDKECRNRADLDHYALIDYKNKNKAVSQVHYLTGYLMQLSLYSLMIKQTFPHLKPVNQIMVVISSPKILSIYYADENKLKVYQEWAIRILEAFWKKQKFDLDAMKREWGYYWHENYNRPYYEKNHLFPTRLYCKEPLDF
jgi:hypothetical protein